MSWPPLVLMYNFFLKKINVHYYATTPEMSLDWKMLNGEYGTIIRRPDVLLILISLSAAGIG